MKFPQEQWAEFAVGLTGTSAVIGKGICWYPEKQSLWVVAGYDARPLAGRVFFISIQRRLPGKPAYLQ